MMNIHEIAEYLNVSSAYVLDLLHQGTLKSQDFNDVYAYKLEANARREEALNNLYRQDEEMGWL